MQLKKQMLVGIATTAMTIAMPIVAMAQPSNPFNKSLNITEKTQSAAGLGTTSRSLPDMIGNVINVVLGFLGILLLGYMLYAGFLWMTSGGSDEKAEQATTMIKNAVIGLVIIVAAFSISSFVLNSLINVSNGNVT